MASETMMCSVPRSRDELIHPDLSDYTHTHTHYSWVIHTYRNKVTIAPLVVTDN